MTFSVGMLRRRAPLSLDQSGATGAGGQPENSRRFTRVNDDCCGTEAIDGTSAPGHSRADAGAAWGLPGVRRGDLAEMLPCKPGARRRVGLGGSAGRGDRHQGFFLQGFSFRVVVSRALWLCTGWAVPMR